MSDKNDVETLSDSACFTLLEICERCGLHEATITEWVAFGVVEPQGEVHSGWRFTPAQLARIQRARRLQRDLELNSPGVALALDLIEELEIKRKELDSLRRQLGLTS